MPKSGKLPIAAMHCIIANAGGERISETAPIELQKALEDISSMIAKEALVFMQNAQRVTLKDVDIRIAAERARHKLK